MGRKFAAVLKKYDWLVNDLLPGERKVRIKGLIQILKSLNISPMQKHLYEDLRFLKQEGLNPIDVKEILDQGKPFKENIAYGVKLIESFL